MAYRSPWPAAEAAAAQAASQLNVERLAGEIRRQADRRGELTLEHVKRLL